MDGAISAIKTQFSVLFGKRSPATVFMIGFAVMILIFIIAGIITRGGSISGFLFDDKRDMMMDFFKSVAESYDLPYTLYHVIYPPLATMAYGVLASLMVPFVEASVYEPMAYALRDSQIGMAIYFAIVVLTLYVVYTLLDRMSTRDNALKVSAVLIVLFSSPIIASIERGNCILTVAALVGFFLLFFKSENKWLRYGAYISLAIATAIKLYPIVFWALLFARGDYKKAAIGITVSILLTFIPFVFTDGSFSIFLENLSILSAQRGTTDPTIVHLVLSLTIGPTIGAAASTILGYVIVAAISVLCLIVLMSDEVPLWEKTMLCACILATLPLTSVAMYSSIYIIFPAFMFMLEEKEMTRRNWFLVILLVVILAPIPSLLGPVSGSFQIIIVTVKLAATAALMAAILIQHRNIRVGIPWFKEGSDAEC